MKKIQLLMCAAWVVLFAWPVGTAKAQSTLNYCYESSCFATLGEAEDYMRSNTTYGAYAIRSGTALVSVSATKTNSRIMYEVRPRAPIVMYPPVYMVGGLNPTDSDVCSSDPVHPTYCEDEASVGMALQQRVEAISPQCIYTEIGFKGDFPEYYEEIRKYKSNIGYIGWHVGPDSRQWHYKVQCPTWSTSEDRDSWFFKYQSFICDGDFSPVITTNKIIPNSELCLPSITEMYISVVQATQTKSCAINSNPCFPATGNKARIEHDIYFSGFDFFRAFNSLGEIQSTYAHGNGWSDALSDYVIYKSSFVMLISAEGYFEKFQVISTNRYRGQKNHGDYLSRETATSPWILTKANGEVRTYDALTGFLSAVAPSGRNLLSITRSDGRIAAVTDQIGRRLIFDYNHDGLISGIGLPDGGSVLYDYDDDRNLTKVTREDGSVRTYFYGEQPYAPAGMRNLMTGIEDNGERYATFSYDSQRRVTSSALKANGKDIESVSITYDASGNAQVVDALGSNRSYTIGGSPYRDITGSTIGGITTSSTYNTAGRLTALVDGRGNKTTIAYNDTVGTTSSQVVTTAEAGKRTEIVTRDLANLISERRVLDGSGIVRSLDKYIYDTAFHITYTCSYGDSASTYVCGSAATAPAGVRQIHYSYCSVGTDGCPIDGLLTSVDGSRSDLSDAVRYAYRTTSNCTSDDTCSYRAGDLWTITNALDQTTEILSYDGAGRPLTVKSPSGTATAYAYDARGRLKQSSAMGANGAARTTLIDYWPTGLVKQVTDGDGVTTAFTYDAAHRLRQISDGVGNAISYTLDDAGNPLLEQIHDTAGTLKYTVSRVYDQLGQLKTLADATANPTNFTHDANGNQNSVTDALGRVSSSDHDPLNRLAKVVQDLGGVAATSSFEYDTLDNVTKVTDPKGLATTYSYNGFGELETLVSPDTGTTTFTYDEAGNAKTRTDARGVTTTYSYDALNRLLVAQYPDPTSDVAYTYDVVPQACAAAEQFPVGRLSTMTDASGTTSYCYSPFGEVVRKVQTVNGQPLTVQYSYTAGGRLATMTYPDGALVDYVRNGLGQISEVGVTSMGGSRMVLLTGASYLPFGPSTGWVYGNGRALARTFDQDYRPTGVADSFDQLKVGLGYDAVGSLTGLNVSGEQSLLGYDALGRLTAFKDQATDSTIEAYTYDATGNRLSFSNATGTDLYTYPTDSHRLASVAGIARTYDATGSTTSIGGSGKEFVYDPRGRLSQVKLGSTVARNYAYNGKGERLLRWLGSDATLTAYDEGGQWLGDYDAQGLAKQQAIWMDDKPVGLLVDGQLYYIEPDHLGSPRLVVDPARDAPVWRWDLSGEAFGSTAPDEDPDGDSVPFVFDMRFPGQRYDAASGLNQNGFRDGYDSGSGRYTQPDPIGQNGGINSYAYVDSNPLIFTDALGLAKDQACVAAYTTAGAVCGGAAGYYGGGALGGVGGAAVCSPSGPGAAVCAVGGAAGGSALGGAAGSAIGSVLGNLAGQANCPDDDCTKLIGQINSLVSELKRRYSELIRDERGLPATGPMSIAGHQQQFRNKQTRLRGLLNEAANKGCTGYDTDAWMWATRPTPR